MRTGEPALELNILDVMEDHADAQEVNDAIKKMEAFIQSWKLSWQKDLPLID
jgi:hypothetical protein